ncbi:radical SAM protein [Terasakiella sp. SH-1]|uniref:radical SAM protein n=1 Tax=Terasakiella sp. SH-1 TaxID=2560057 RepID=UPI001073FE62|nr:radical SAM protein [Terasakiella sp. SH-1]
MAGAKGGEFKELLSPFLKEKLERAKWDFGEDSKEVFAITHQYLRSPLENLIQSHERRRHYEAEMEIEFEGQSLIGVERLYRRTILIEPTTVCAAHCRWCLRGQYPVKTMTQDDIVHAARYIGSPQNKQDIDEVLITGGDPLMSQKLLSFTLQALTDHAPNVINVRIGSRVPFQDPKRINDGLIAIFKEFSQFNFEIGINVNHPIEFWPESVSAIKKLQSIGVTFYNQHPLLKGVNDDIETLIELYSLLRKHRIEAHYFFHAIPMRGMQHHRTSLRKGLALANQLSSCGQFSGRAKPRYAVLSDIGKIVIYQDTIVDEHTEDNKLLLRSGFKLEDRQRWNPSWQKPDSVVLANDGTMMTWYQDGTDKTLTELSIELAQNINL